MLLLWDQLWRVRPNRTIELRLVENSLFERQHKQFRWGKIFPLGKYERRGKQNKNPSTRELWTEIVDIQGFYGINQKSQFELNSKKNTRIIYNPHLLVQTSKRNKKAASTEQLKVKNGIRQPSIRARGFKVNNWIIVFPLKCLSIIIRKIKKNIIKPSQQQQMFLNLKLTLRK